MNVNGLVTPDRVDRRVTAPPGDMSAVSSRQTQQMLGAYPFASATPSTHSKQFTFLTYGEYFHLLS